MFGFKDIVKGLSDHGMGSSRRSWLRLGRGGHGSAGHQNFDRVKSGNGDRIDGGALTGEDTSSFGVGMAIGIERENTSI